MVDGFAESGQGTKAWAQAVAAVVLVGGLAGVFWALQKADRQKAAEPAVCSSTHDRTVPARYVSGARLCEALNRADLPVLLGTPLEHAETADGSESWTTLAGGTKYATPEADVTLKTYSVRLSASYDDLPVADAARLLGGSAQRRTVLGHPAVLYSDRTIALSFHDGKADSGPGGIARGVLVSRDTKDGGGCFEVVIWRQDDVPPDDTALLRLAERVLPTIPGWTGGERPPAGGQDSRKGTSAAWTRALAAGGPPRPFRRPCGPPRRRCRSAGCPAARAAPGASP
ncbi:DUF6215 domain-containing protein [Streptomyces sp. NPDC006739]|uniref:DUF6215 domain-containing protein n=1 Tax=Streptomyces sp. NPDC006739 TaxID=3364763 RepID=UPI0036BFD068